MQKVVELAKIMSDINRVKIITLILRDKEVCVCEICDTLELSQPLVSRHLKQMRENDILSVTKKGKWMVYSLSSDVSSAFECLMAELQRHIDMLPKLIVCDSLNCYQA